MTDVCLGLSVLLVLRNSDHRWVKEGAKSLKQSLPYELPSVDNDNGFEFINKTRIRASVHKTYKQCKMS